MAYASLGRRGLALLVDGALSLVVGIPMAVLTGGVRKTTVVTPGGTFRNYSISLTGTALLVTVVIWLAYMTYTEGTRGASLGKRMTGLRVAKLDGTAMDLEAALIRNLVRIVDAFPFYLIGVVLAMSSPQRQRLGDRAAGTAVILAPQPAVQAARADRGFGPQPASATVPSPATPAIPPPPPPG